MTDLLRAEPFAGRGGRTRLANALGITQPAVTQILQGGGVAPETAVAVAKLAGVDPGALLKGGYVGTAITTRYPNLELCIGYHLHRNRWSPPVVAAARAGLWSSDVYPDEWERRLDELQRLLGTLTPPADPPVAPIRGTA